MSDFNLEEYYAEQRRALVQGLRDVATFIETHPDIPTPVVNPMNVFCDDKQAMAKAVRALGSAQKHVNDDWFFVRRSFGPVELDLNCRRDLVCERMVIGKKIIAAQPEREVDDVIWDCGAILDGVEQVSE